MRDGASSAACIDTSIQVSVPSAESALEASAAGSLQPEQDGMLVMAGPYGPAEVSAADS
jgi:hypothetical protein